MNSAGPPLQTKAVELSDKCARRIQETDENTQIKQEEYKQQHNAECSLERRAKQHESRRQCVVYTRMTEKRTEQTITSASNFNLLQAIVAKIINEYAFKFSRCARKNVMINHLDDAS